jgi:hypothetical protein
MYVIKLVNIRSGAINFRPASGLTSRMRRFDRKAYWPKLSLSQLQRLLRRPREPKLSMTVNVKVVSLATLLSALPSRRATAPNLQIRAQGILFRNTISPATVTEHAFTRARERQFALSGY